LRNLPLTDGTVMPEATIAYETYGRLTPNGRNAILCTHGYTGSHHFAGRSLSNGNWPGSWDGLIGPGKTIDTDANSRFRSNPVAPTRVGEEPVSTRLRPSGCRSRMPAERRKLPFLISSDCRHADAGSLKQLKPSMLCVEIALKHWALTFAFALPWWSG
jgi:homoserine O-acetyltransferase